MCKINSGHNASLRSMLNSEIVKNPFFLFNPQVLSNPSPLTPEQTIKFNEQLSYARVITNLAPLSLQNTSAMPSIQIQNNNPPENSPDLSMLNPKIVKEYKWLLNSKVRDKKLSAKRIKQFNHQLHSLAASVISSTTLINHYKAKNFQPHNNIISQNNQQNSEKTAQTSKNTEKNLGQDNLVRDTTTHHTQTFLNSKKTSSLQHMRFAEIRPRTEREINATEALLLLSAENTNPVGNHDQTIQQTNETATRPQGRTLSKTASPSS